MASMMKKAQKTAVKLKIGIAGASGSGKTMSSLLLGYGLVKAQHPELPDEEIWNRICVIDTENGSADLYANHQVGLFTIGEFNKIDLSAPFTPQKYQEAIDCCEENGIEFCIIDSLTHAWAGEGGMLDKQARIAATGKNSYTAWRDVTPEHNRLVDKILQCKMHVVADLRTKTEYVLEDNGKGKQVPKKVGMAPIFRDGIEYEFTIVFDLAPNHYATASKDRTGLFDDLSFVIGPDVGKKIDAWLRNGAPQHEKSAVLTRPVTTGDVKPQEAEPQEAKTPVAPLPVDEPVLASVPEEEDDDEFDSNTSASAAISLEDFVEYIRGIVKTADADQKKAIGDVIRKFNNGNVKYKEIADESIRASIYNELKNNNWRG